MVSEREQRHNRRLYFLYGFDVCCLCIKQETDRVTRVFDCQHKMVPIIFSYAKYVVYCIYRFQLLPCCGWMDFVDAGCSFKFKWLDPFPCSESYPRTILAIKSAQNRCIMCLYTEIISWERERDIGSNWQGQKQRVGRWGWRWRREWDNRSCGHNLADGKKESHCCCVERNNVGICASHKTCYTHKGRLLVYTLSYTYRYTAPIRSIEEKRNL